MKRNSQRVRSRGQGLGTARRTALLLVTAILATLFLAGCNDEGPKYSGPALPYKAEPPPPDPEAVIKTSAGDITVQLFEEDAPNTVANFITLADNKFYDNLLFHRIVKGFMIQGGDPKGDGTGGPGYKFPDEIDDNSNPMDKYTLAMANSGANTNGSQFFIVTDPKGRPELQHKHTIFGKVTEGQEVVDTLDKSPVVPNKTGENESPKPEVKILSIRITSRRAHPYEVHDKILDPPPPPKPVVLPPIAPPALAPKPDEKKPDEKNSDAKVPDQKTDAKGENKPDETKK